MDDALGVGVDKFLTPMLAYVRTSACALTHAQSPAQAQKEARHNEQEAQIGLTQATEDDDDEYREAWRK